MIFERSKQGRGAYSVQVEADGRTTANGLSFANAQRAYDHYRGVFDRTSDDAAWNICYALEDFIRNGEKV